MLNRNFQVNTMGLLYLARRAAPAMVAAGKGAIIVTGNTSAQRGRANFAGFAPTKAAQRILAAVTLAGFTTSQTSTTMGSLAGTGRSSGLTCTATSSRTPSGPAPITIRSGPTGPITFYPASTGPARIMPIGPVVSITAPTTSMAPAHHPPPRRSSPAWANRR